MDQLNCSVHALLLEIQQVRESQVGFEAQVAALITYIPTSATSPALREAKTDWLRKVHLEDNDDEAECGNMGLQAAGDQSQLLPVKDMEQNEGILHRRGRDIWNGITDVIQLWRCLRLCDGSFGQTDWERLFTRDLTRGRLIEAERLMLDKGKSMEFVDTNARCGHINGKRAAKALFLVPGDITGNKRQRNWVPITLQTKAHEDKSWLFRRQVPVRLCYSFTIHKSQGVSLDRSTIINWSPATPTSKYKPIMLRDLGFTAVTCVTEFQLVAFGDLPDLQEFERSMSTPLYKHRIEHDRLMREAHVRTMFTFFGITPAEEENWHRQWDQNRRCASTWRPPSQTDRHTSAEVLVRPRQGRNDEELPNTKRQRQHHNRDDGGDSQTPSEKPQTKHVTLTPRSATQLSKKRQHERGDADSEATFCPYRNGALLGSRRRGHRCEFRSSWAAVTSSSA